MSDIVRSIDTVTAEIIVIRDNAKKVFYDAVIKIGCRLLEANEKAETENTGYEKPARLGTQDAGRALDAGGRRPAAAAEIPGKMRLILCARCYAELMARGLKLRRDGRNSVMDRCEMCKRKTYTGRYTTGKAEEKR